MEIADIFFTSHGRHRYFFQIGLRKKQYLHVFTVVCFDFVVSFPVFRFDLGKDRDLVLSPERFRVGCADRIAANAVPVFHHETVFRAEREKSANQSESRATTDSHRE